MKRGKGTAFAICLTLLWTGLLLKNAQGQSELPKSIRNRKSAPDLLQAGARKPVPRCPIHHKLLVEGVATIHHVGPDYPKNDPYELMHFPRAHTIVLKGQNLSGDPRETVPVRYCPGCREEQKSFLACVQHYFPTRLAEATPEDARITTAPAFHSSRVRPLDTSNSTTGNARVGDRAIPDADQGEVFAGQGGFRQP